MGKTKGRGVSGREQPAPPKKRTCVVDPRCLEDLAYWAGTEARTLGRIFDLMDEVLREPFAGRGKPELVKHLGPDTWSRRITQEHRLVYVVFDDRVVFVQARYHY